MAAKLNYRINHSKLCELDLSGSIDEVIVATTDAADGYDVVGTFAEAKAKAIKHVEGKIDEWKRVLKQTRKFKKADVRQEEE